MTFANWWRRHRNGFLGFIGGAIPGLLGINGLIAPEHQKWWLAAGVLIGLLISRFNYTNQQGPTS